MKLSERQQRIVVGIFLAFCLFATANYYIGFGLFGRLDTGAFLLSVAVLLFCVFLFESRRRSKRGANEGSNNRWRGP